MSSDETTQTPAEPAPEAALANAHLEEMQSDRSSSENDNENKTAADLEAVFDIPVKISAVLGRSRMPVSDLLQLDVGSVVELDRQVGEAIDIFVNNRLVARGEVVLVEDKLGITMTEIIKSDR